MSLARSTFDAARGRWREVLIALGVPHNLLNGRNQPCPFCGGKDRFRYDDLKGDAMWCCTHCQPPGSGYALKLLMRLHGWSFQEAAQRVDSIVGNLPAAKPIQRPKASADQLNALWRNGRHVTNGDTVWRYLKRRGIHCEAHNLGELRFVPALFHAPTGGKHPAMLARMTGADGKPKQIHRTYLTPDGGKAPIEPVRMFMPGDMPFGGAVRLGAIAPRLGIAEGIETALAAAQIHDMTVWATTTATMLERWHPPPEASDIYIFADGDGNFVGQAAAYALAKRLHAEAERDKIVRRVMVLLPEHGKKDWNDSLNVRLTT